MYYNLAQEKSGMGGKTSGGEHASLLVCRFLSDNRGYWPITTC